VRWPRAGAGRRAAAGGAANAGAAGVGVGYAASSWVGGRRRLTARQALTSRAEPRGGRLPRAGRDGNHRCLHAPGKGQGKKQAAGVGRDWQTKQTDGVRTRFRVEWGGQRRAAWGGGGASRGAASHLTKGVEQAAPGAACSRERARADTRSTVRSAQLRRAPHSHPAPPSHEPVQPGPPRASFTC